MTIFLDVADDERSLVSAAFPDATFLPADATAEAMAGAEIIVAFVTSRFDAALLAQLPALRLLCTRSAGTDHIDLAACRERGITVCSVPDYGAHVIAEHAFALLLSAVRHVPEGDQRVKAGEFSWRGLKGMALRGKTMGVAGTGRIGRALIQIATGFGMRVIAYDAFKVAGIEYVEWPELWRQSDVVSLHLPLTAETKGIVNSETLKDAKPGVVIVNTARGGLIDPGALIAALDRGQVGRALLDVLPDEHDLSAEHGLIDHPKIVVTPHIAFYTDDSVKELYAKTAESIRQWRTGERPALALA
ncbi:MAG: hypothetical protein KBC95_00615 [Candidatus Peribacteraceae bacterium]|nr:hypothetical protein [Candidatus Peribacteraceae bacterium]